MTTNIRNDIDFSNMKGKRTVIPDNEYLPFVKVKKTLVDMSPGDIISWPIHKDNSVRITAGRVGKEMNRVYHCNKNHKDKTIDVCRFS